MRAADEAVARAVARLAAAGRERVRGAEVRGEDDRVVIEGRGLRRRMLADPALRWIGGWLR